MANRNIERAVRVALLAAGAASVGAYSAGAYAQDAGATPDEIEQVIVTGSRIPQPNLEGTSPVTVVGAQDIQLEGALQVEDIMNRLPQVFANQGGNLSNGSSGTSTIDLRGLGPNRTLVLVNGRRLPAGSPRGPVAPDVNAIPTPLIKRVEVLTGGASAVYGSDAVAGVVNFIMMDDFEGVQFDGNYNAYWHNNHDQHMQDLVAARGFDKAPGSVWDGESYGLSVTMGSNFADGKGNATLYLGYTSVDPLLQSERDYSACSLDGGAGAIAGNRNRCGGSGTSYPGYFTDFSTFGYSLDPDTGAIVDGFQPYNFGPLNYFQRPQERWQADAYIHYDLNDSAQVYGEFMFMDNQSTAQIAPSGSFFTTQNIHCNNPLLQQDGAQWYNALCGDPSDTVTMYIGRRNVEGGGRQDNLGLTQYRGVVGVKGMVAEHWNYDVYAQYGEVLFSEWYGRDFSKTRINRSLDVVDDGSGNAVCASVLDGTDPNCVPWNIWTIGGVTPEAVKYLQIPLFSNGHTDQTVVNASLSSNLGDYGITLPTAKDGVGIAFGAEYRQEGLQFNADANYQANEGAGQGGPTLPVKGGYNVMDYFAEVRVPLVQDMPFAKDLTFNGSYRYSSYSTDTDTNTYGLGLDWQIIDDVKLRGSYQHAVRAPNIIELYSAASVGLFDWTDICGAGTTLTAAQCANTGLTGSLASKYGSNGLISPAGQYNGFFGGNPDLSPETANSWTAGIVLTPTFLEGFSFTVDYWSIKVDDTISTVSPATTVKQCALTGSASYCNLVHRDPNNGSLWVGDGFVTATNVNIGTTKTSGWDFNALYALRMNDWGSLNFSLVGTYIDVLEYQPLPGVTKYDCVGYYGPTNCGTPTPDLRTNFRTTWSTPWNVDLSLAWRYYSSVDIDLSSNDSDLSGPYISAYKTLDAQNYLDIAAVYNFAEKYTLSVGINNVTDEDPPLTGQGGLPYANGNTYPQVYDALGRYVFFGLTAKF
ncbi:MAG: TonB-dependent receptor [Steroidobacteraceae bacterium]